MARACQSASVAVLTIATIGPATALEFRIKDGDAPFCERLDHFKAFVTDALLAGHMVYDRYPDCVRLKAGTRLEVEGEVAASGNAKVLAVTVHGAGGEVFGFTLDVRIEDLPAAGR